MNTQNKTWQAKLIGFTSVALLVTVATVMAVSIFWQAPLEELANPAKTPNPAKAPWYFLGLQELLHYYPPLVSGVILPGLLVVALVVVPYTRINLQRVPLAVQRPARVLLAVWGAIAALGALSYTTGSQPVWPFIGTLLSIGAAITVGVGTRSQQRPLIWLRSRGAAFWVFSWFLLTAAVLTIIGVFFRGPGWVFTLPWRDGMFY